jgi:hypothetical protein
MSLDQAIGYLDDLNQFGGHHQRTIIRQIQFELINEKIKSESLSWSQNKRLFRYLRTNFLNQWRNRLLQETQVSKVKFEFKQSSNLSSTHWNYFLETSNLIKELCLLFNLNHTLVIQFTPTNMVIKSHVGPEQWNESIKTEVYRLSRILLQKKSLLTYRLSETEQFNNIGLELVIDFSDLIFQQRKELYKVNFQTNKISAFLSPVLKNYQVSHEEALANKFPHKIIRVNESMDVEQCSQLKPEHLLGDVCVIHFSFLFRPVTILLPRAGVIVSGTEIDRSTSLKSQSTQFIDLFSILNK